MASFLRLPGPPNARSCRPRQFPENQQLNTMAGETDSTTGAQTEGLLCMEATIQGASSAPWQRLELQGIKSAGVSCTSGGGRTLKRVRDLSERSDSTLSLPLDSETGFGEVAPPPASANRLGVRCLSHGSSSVIGRRREMEDAVTVAPGFSASYDFFGVYDGHGGARVAHVCRERLHLVMAEEVAAMEVSANEEGLWKVAFAASFRRVDGEVLAVGTRVDASEKTEGSTAVVAVVGAERIFVANCGDSRAVLSRAGVALPLSSDHKPERPDEMERVEAAGGRVINWDGYRVLGVLATSRSIGDYYLKPYVISEPEVTVTDRTDRDEFLILASDGLWDVVSNEVACKVTRQCLSGRAAKMFPDAVHGRSASVAATLLTELAISRGSKDNITVVVIELKKWASKR